MTKLKETYNVRRKTGTVAEADNRVVEIIQVGLVLGLELMEEVEEAESEYSVGLNEGGRKPCGSKQLATAVCGVFGETRTVADDNLVDAGYVENGELTELRWIWARLANGVT